MPKQPLSVTLTKNNILWLRGRAAAAGLRSISETLDRLVTEARTSGSVAEGSIRSVVGTIDIASSDPLLEGADGVIRRQLDASLRRPFESASRTRGKRRGSR